MPNWTALYILLFSLAIAFIYQPLSSNNVFNVPASKLAFVSTPQRILLLTAHPDDEALFFAPTIISLVAQAKAIAVEKKNNPIAIASQTPVPSALEIYSLCISTGNADGIGGVRTQELRRSLDILEINPENSWIIDHPHLQDNLTATWDPEIIADAIKHYVLDNKITSILTFDEGGVSKHPNHKSLPSGAKHLLETHQFTGPTPQLFTLISVSLISKYISIIAPVMTKLNLYGFRTLTWYERQIERLLEAFEIIPTLGENSPTTKILMPVFVSGMPEYGKALAAMCTHKSQLVWFRWLNVMFSRYMWVNEWAEVKV